MKKSIIEQLETKREKLTKIADSDWPIDPKLAKSHRNRVENAKAFLEELKEIEFFDFGLNAKLVSISTFNKMIEKADYASEEFDGQFLKIYLLKNYPYEELWLVWAERIDKI